jgi:hypothetical protein
MKSFFVQKYRASALVYATIIAAVSGALILIVSSSTLVATITSNQNVDGIQAYYAAESAQELAYSVRRRVVALNTYPDDLAGSSLAGRAVIDTTNPLNNPETVEFVTTNTLNTPASRSPNVITMDFKIYLSATTNPARSHLLISDGYYSAAQYNIRTRLGNQAQVLFPYIYIPSD